MPANQSRRVMPEHSASAGMGNAGSKSFVTDRSLHLALDLMLTGYGVDPRVIVESGVESVEVVGCAGYHQVEGVRFVGVELALHLLHDCLEESAGVMPNHFVELA